MKVLITGSDGYIGSVLGATLLERGLEVVGIDCGFYRDGWLFNDQRPRPLTLTKDIRNLTAKDVEGFDAVVHLAELSNDPLGEHDANITYDINHRGSVNLALACKSAGVPRFVYASSCSVYGAAEDGSARDEQSETKPLTAYAKCKIMVERDVGALADASFSPVFMRNATAFGASPRMRFDIVLNNLSGFAWTTKEIKMTSDGTPWRPLVHIEDISRAVVAVLDAPAELVRDQAFNVGATSENYRIAEVAEIVRRTVPGSKVVYAEGGGPDLRCYRVSGDKLARVLPAAAPTWTVAMGAEELYEAYVRNGLTLAEFESSRFLRIRRVKELQTAGAIDSSLRRLAPSPAGALAGV